MLQMIIKKICEGLLSSILIGMSVVPTYAANLGVHGSIYSIAETDLLTGIYHTLGAMQRSGELARQNKAVVKQSIAHSLRPHPVTGIHDLKHGQPPIQRYFNPSIRLNKTLRDNRGRVIAWKGMRINPLDYHAFHETLLFVDADNPEQMQWTKYWVNNHPKRRHKVILVKGNIKSAMSLLRSRVYFDQAGVLCHRFHITRTPTLVYEPLHQTGPDKQLMIQEVSVD